MDQRVSIKVIVSVVICVLICVGFILYSRWDYQRFREEIGPEFDTSTVQSQNENQIETSNDRATPTLSAEKDGLMQQVQSPNPEHDIESQTHADDIDTVQDDTELGTGKQTPVPDEVSKEFVDGLFDGVNWKEAAKVYRSLQNTDPELAYMSLTYAFGERYGDSADVDTVVDMITQIDSGEATVNNLITLTEAWLRIVPVGAPKDYESLYNGLVSLYALQDLQAEGRNITFTVKFSVED